MFGTAGWQNSDLYTRRNEDRHDKAFPREGIINAPNEKLEADNSDNKIFQQDNAFTFGEGVTDVNEDMQGQKEDAVTEASASNQSSPSLAEYRPNKYHGAASTWRSWTQKERKTVESLQEIRARDLSAHLFNAFALKRREQELKRSAMEGEHQNHPSRMDATSSPFIPPKQWTSWPMPASEVPRTGETISKDQDDIWTLRMPSDPRPSAELEDCLVAVMMQTAKERFYERKWTPDKHGEKSQGGNTADVTGNKEDWPISVDLYHSRELRPVVQADDEKSRQQLRPQVRQIMSQFDSLLMGLHHVRKASVTQEYSSDTDTETDAESTVYPQSPPRKRRRVDPSQYSQRRGRKRTRATPSTLPQKAKASSTMEIDDSSEAPFDLQTSSDSSSASPHQARLHGQSIKRSRNRSRPSRSVARLGLRGWSDVLGIASITSLPQPVVMRAAKRCTDLFGDDMIFRTMFSGNINRENGGNTWGRVEGDEEGNRLTPQSPSRPSSLPTTIPADVATTGPSEVLPAVPGRGKGDHRKQDLICPVERCRRHTKGFSRTWNLNLHLKRVHQDYYRSLTNEHLMEGAS